MRRISHKFAAVGLIQRRAVASIAASAALTFPTATLRAAPSSSSSFGLFRPTAARLQKNGLSDFDDELAFDPTASLQKEAEYVSRGTQVEDLVRAWLPSNADETLRAKLRTHLHTFPVNEMIRNNSITITHIENEKGEEVNRVPGILQNEFGKNIEFTLQQALELAKNYEGKFLVQLADREGRSYCRIRDEKSRFLKTVAAEVDALERALNRAMGVATPADKPRVRKMRDTIPHSFSDVVDAHFIGWRSKKIVQDMVKAHPVKLVIQKFQNPDAALVKMREMLDAIKENAQSLNCVHHCSGIAVGANELSVTLMPVLDIENSKVKTIRHPSDQDWNNAEKRMFEVTGGRGTYQKNNVLKKQSVGAREFRTDRFGRRIE